MIRISLIDPNGSRTLIYSGNGNVNVPLVLDALRIPNAAGHSHVGHHLIEVMSESKEIFADIKRDSSGFIDLYGKVDDVELAPEIPKYFGIRCGLPRGSDNSSASPASITFEFRDRNGNPPLDRSGNPVSSFIFNLNVRASAVEALFSTNAGFDLPEMLCEARRPSNKPFMLTTLVASGNSVTYTSSRLRGSSSFSHGLRHVMTGTTTNSYIAPNGPLLDAVFSGAGNSSIDDYIYFVTATEQGRTTHTIPFISYMPDTPTRGELTIVAYEPDPAGRDRGNETITIQNTSPRTLSLFGCFLEDEFYGRAGLLPGVRSDRTALPRRRLAPNDTLVVQPTFELNNDYDGFTLHNRMGSIIAVAGYVRRMPGGLPPRNPRQTVVFQQTVSVTHTDDARVRLDLEDGDLVIVQPDRSSQLWAGEIPDPGTGPEGWFDANGQQVANLRNWSLPIPTAPIYSLVMTSPRATLIGNKRMVAVVDRNSRLFRVGRQTVIFDRNDEFKGRAFGWGQFDVTVTVMRH